MAEQGRPAWFVGDLGDPWVVAIADRLPASFERRSCPAEMPESWATEDLTPELVVLHRPILTALDIQRISRLRSRGDSPTRVILCLGPHARHDDIVRWSRHFDAVLPEATASETIDRWISPVSERRDVPRPLVQVVSGMHDVRSLLADVCLSAGYLVERRDDRAVLPPNSLAIYDCPVLEPNWGDRLSVLAKSARVIALLGFADRVNVARARAAGAEVCLEWPCDLDDLIHVLDRLAAQFPRQPRRADQAHALPPLPRSSLEAASRTPSLD